MPLLVPVLRFRPSVSRRGLAGHRVSMSHHLLSLCLLDGSLALPRGPLQPAARLLPGWTQQ